MNSLLRDADQNQIRPRFPANGITGTIALSDISAQIDITNVDGILVSDFKGNESRGRRIMFQHHCISIVFAFAIVYGGTIADACQTNGYPLYDTNAKFVVDDQVDDRLTTLASGNSTENWLQPHEGAYSGYFQDQNGGTEGGANGNGGGEEAGGDASDPTNVAFHVMGEWEWQRLKNNEGNLLAFKISPFIPIKVAGQSLLFNFEIPLPQHAGLTGIGHSSGIGDTRLKLFWLISTGGDKVRAFVPAMDAIAPTGDEDRGLGGGQWILMPNFVLALQPTKNLSMYPFFRYVHAEDTQTSFVIDPPLPDPGPLFASNKLRGFNLEWINVLQLNDAFLNWIEFTPDYFKNYTGERSETFTMKYTAAKELRDGLFMMVDFWHPVGGSQTNDYTFKLRLDWYPKTNGKRSCGCRCGR